MASIWKKCHCKVIFRHRKPCIPCQCLLLSTIVLNDKRFLPFGNLDCLLQGRHTWKHCVFTMFSPFKLCYNQEFIIYIGSIYTLVIMYMASAFERLVISIFGDSSLSILLLEHLGLAHQLGFIQIKPGKILLVYAFKF